MLSYEQWDHIADAYTPLLLVLSIVALGVSLQKNGWRMAARELSFLIVCLVFVYGVMWADQRLHWWADIGLDYSTHTAVSLVFVAYLSLTYRRMAWAITASMLLYAMLMLYQRYHRFADIATTALAVLPVIVVLHRFVFQLHAEPPKHSESIM